MLGKLLRVGMCAALSATVVLGACPECHPREAPEHSCCDPAPQSTSSKTCPDRNEILRNYEKPATTDATVSLVAVGGAPRIDNAPAPAPAPAIEIPPRAEGPPDLFLRNAAILI